MDTKLTRGLFRIFRDRWAQRHIDDDAEMCHKVAFVVEQDHEQLGRFYDILNILDTKSTALMGINAFLAAFGVAFIEFDRKTEFPHPVEIGLSSLSAVLLLLLLTSAVLCFMVVSVEWPFMRLFKKDAGCDQAKPTYSTDDELRYLSRVVRERTTYYRLAWHFTAWGLCDLAFLGIAYVAN
jgi:hypothetical protein